MENPKSSYISIFTMHQRASVTFNPEHGNISFDPIPTLHAFTFSISDAFPDLEAWMVWLMVTT